jgi:hypothetical protein
MARADGTQRRRFARVRPHWAISRASWSPQGKFAAVIRGADLVRLDQKGHLDRDVLPDFSYPPEDGAVWSPDGRWLAVEAGGHGGSIGLMPAAGGGGWDNWRLLWETPTLSDGLDSPSWTADSRR